jgi:tetratricopeptide (TPR) repeat protein
MARSYLQVARYYQGVDRPEMAVDPLVWSTQIAALPAACNALARLAYQTGEQRQAADWWRQSLLFDANQADVSALLGLVLADLGQLGPALQHLERAVELDSSLQYDLGPRLAAVREQLRR